MVEIQMRSISSSYQHPKIPRNALEQGIHRRCSRICLLRIFEGECGNGRGGPIDQLLYHPVRLGLTTKAEDYCSLKATNLASNSEGVCAVRTLDHI